MVCMGMAPVRTLDEPLREYCLENGIEYANIGDSKKTRKIINGVQEGRNVLKILEKMEILH
jgi:2,4-dienoyl-CoA reductase (NADPH2)